MLNQESAGGRFDILLVDDNPADAKLFQTALAQSGSRATLYWVATAEEALALLEQQGRFANVGVMKLAVTDVNLPGMDGFELLQMLRRHPNWQFKPVIVMSSSASRDDVNRCYRLGANSYFTKAMSFDLYRRQVSLVVQYWLDLAQLPQPNHD